MRDDNIPMKESKHGGIPVTEVESAQRALLDSIRASKEQPEPVEEETETEDMVSEQAMDIAESVENEVVDTQELTTEDLVDDGQQEQVSEPKVYTVKIDGKDAQVTEDELLSGYSRQADYTRKSQVLAEQRKKIEEELSATQQERQRYTQALEQLEESTDYEIAQLKSQDLEKLKEEDPLAYMQRKDALRDLEENKIKIANQKAKAQEAEQKEIVTNKSRLK